MTGREPVFDTFPTGPDIAKWFNDEERAGRFQNQGGDALWLSREPHGWLWHVATVDHDDQVYYLLAIGNGDTQDLLFVTTGLRCALACEWRGRPSKEQNWGYRALTWMASLIETYEADWAATSDHALTDASERYDSRPLGPENPPHRV